MDVSMSACIYDASITECVDSQLAALSRLASAHSFPLSHHTHTHTHTHTHRTNMILFWDGHGPHKMHRRVCVGRKYIERLDGFLHLPYVIERTSTGLRHSISFLSWVIFNVGERKAEQNRT
mmetsp:Transcript_10147/g.15536  ORF Transcript_10147/g.15536 Transcript_10147/m.15536 type:complete len:121 (+) Transcript_10147:1005-1367(+)